MSLDPQADRHPHSSSSSPVEATPIEVLTASIDALGPPLTSQAHTPNGHEMLNHLNHDHTHSQCEASSYSSSRLEGLPRLKHHHHCDPPIRLVFLANESEGELHFGLEQISLSSVRNNLNFVKPIPTNDYRDPHSNLPSINQHINQSRIRHDLRTPNKAQAYPQAKHQFISPASCSIPEEFWWFLRFQHDPLITPRGFSITTSHHNFIELANSSPTHLLDILSSIEGHHSHHEDTPPQRFLITITYNRKCEAFRALGHVLALTRHYTTHLPEPFRSHSHQLCPQSWNAEAFEQIVSYLNNRREICHFDTLGLMIDCSRNGVLNVDRVKEMLRYIALMGLNMLQLYTEDTYEIRNEPFFGYFRGPYTQIELREVDDYAYALGIEVVPCIQTLGHLGQMLQWPRYGAMRDTHEVLLVGSVDVYQFIEKMILSITQPLRSKKIHIGMDEAHGVGEGRYRQLFGQKDGTAVFTDHLRKVNRICAKLQLKPMIWSDMLFCLAAKNNSLGGYYDSSNPATPELVQSIPPEIELVYWDYYHTSSGPYINKINQHKDLNFKPPAMASGIWTWSRFWTALPFTIETIRASMKAIKDPTSGVTSALTTIWGDEGNECDIWSALPGILYYAEHAYTLKDEVDVGLLKRKFDGVVGGSFDDFVFASKLDDLQVESHLTDEKARFTPNLSKWLIWEEPFYAILSPQYAGHDLETHYSQLSTYLDEATSQSVKPTHTDQTPDKNRKAAEGKDDDDDDDEGQTIATGKLIELPMNRRLKLPNLISKVLTLKCHLRDRLAKAYQEKDLEELIALAGPQKSSRLSRLRKYVEKLWTYHRDLWMAMYKPFGWEVLDLRYGGLRARLDTMHKRLIGYLDPVNKKITRLEELEVPLELIYPSSGAVMMLDYHRVSRPQYC